MNIVYSKPFGSLCNLIFYLYIACACREVVFKRASIYFANKKMKINGNPFQQEKYDASIDLESECECECECMKMRRFVSKSVFLKRIHLFVIK